MKGHPLLNRITRIRVTAVVIAAVAGMLICLGCAAKKADFTSAACYRGTLHILIADDFKHQTSETHYHLMDARDNSMVRLKFQNGPPDPPIPSGTRVEIRGYRNNDHITVESLHVP